MNEPKLTVIYTQLNKDSAYWPEKVRAGKQEHGGHTAGLFRVLEDGRVVQQLLVDAGLGTIAALCESQVGFDWGAPLEVLVTHGHPDHHLELMILSEVYSQRIAAPKAKPLLIRCSLETFERWLKPVHGFRFEPRPGQQTLQFAESIRPLRVPFLTSPAGARVGCFTVEAVENDHFPGALNFVVQFGRTKVLIGWDLRSLPDPDQMPVLKGASLALVEANTVLASPRSGHASAQELCESGFLRKLAVKDEGIFLVHSGGRVDEEQPQCLSDGAFLHEIQLRWSGILGPLRLQMAKARQSWVFPV